MYFSCSEYQTQCSRKTQNVYTGLQACKKSLQQISQQSDTKPQLSQVSSKNVNVTSVGNIHPIYVTNALVSHTLLQIEPHQNLKQGH